MHGNVCFARDISRRAALVSFCGTSEGWTSLPIFPTLPAYSPVYSLELSIGCHGRIKLATLLQESHPRGVLLTILDPSTGAYELGAAAFNVPCSIPASLRLVTSQFANSSPRQSGCVILSSEVPYSPPRGRQEMTAQSGAP